MKRYALHDTDAVGNAVGEPVEVVTVYEPGDKPVNPADYLDQGEWWKTKDQGWMRISDMTDSHRLNAARWMVRHAEAWEQRAAIIELGWYQNAPDEVVDSWMQDIDERMGDPQTWIRETALHRALIAGLAPDMRVDDDLMAQLWAEHHRSRRTERLDGAPVVER
jgi:hypothetical protein